MKTAQGSERGPPTIVPHTQKMQCVVLIFKDVVSSQIRASDLYVLSTLETKLVSAVFLHSTTTFTK